MALALAFGFSTQAMAAPARPAWACDNTSPSCYGEVYYDWGYAGAVNGLYGVMSVSATNCFSCVWNSTYKMHINDTRWLVDKHSALANNCTFQACWVEVGNIASADPKVGTLVQHYYWFDNRPCGGSYHYNYGSSSLNDNGYTASASITGNGSGVCGINPTTWSVSITGPSGSASGTSTNNPMEASDVEFGGEIEGMPGYGQHAGNVYFTYSEYRQGSSWSYFTWNSGTYVQSSPWSSYWSVVPNGSNNGGSWYTYCPC